MPRSTHQAVLALACVTIATYSSTVLAEVSDKEPTTELLWKIGIIAAVICLATARIKPWLGAICFAPAAIWFVSLFLEIHSPDIGPHLRIEQGNGYYLQAYAAFAIAICGLASGYFWFRRQRL